MLKAYINYANGRVVAHFMGSCGFTNRQGGHQGRVRTIDRTTISNELQAFANNDYYFTSQAGINDMWLLIDFMDPEFELAVLKHVQGQLARSYAPFNLGEITIHCE